MRWLGIGMLATACAAPEVSRFPVVDGREGSYALVERPIPELIDPEGMQGFLGNGTVGGYLDLGRGQYAGGGPIRVRYRADGEVAVPLHDDGVVLWSYYHCLSRVRAELQPFDIGVERIFPIPFAYQPVVGGSALTGSNAAYAAEGAHFFVLLTDPPGADVPLAANPGVVRHEFGHALFQHLTAGDVREPFALDGVFEVRALNEGFADAFAAISLDDPVGFWGLSLPNPADRRLDVVRRAADAVSAERNPYSRGSVYASLAWALREQTDPDTALQLLMATTARWAIEAEESQATGVALTDRWAVLLVIESQSATDLCDAYTARFDRACP